MSTKQKLEALWEKEYVSINKDELELLNQEDFDEPVSGELIGKLLARSFLVKIDADKILDKQVPEDFVVYISTRKLDEEDRSSVAAVCVDESKTYHLQSSVDYIFDIDDRVVMNTAQEVLILNDVNSLVVLPEQLENVISEIVGVDV